MPLSDLNEKYQPQADKAKVALPPLPPGIDVVIAFDQALVNTGTVTYDGTNVAAWTIRAPKETEDVAGHERTLRRSMALQRALISVLSRMEADFLRILVLHETPAVAKGRMQRTESSLMAAHCVRWAVEVMQDDDRSGHHALADFSFAMISAQRAKTVITGNPRADKEEVRAALAATYLPEQTGPCTNDNERDALALIVTHLKDAR